MKKWKIALLIVIAVAFGLWFVKIFPDPYHTGEPVNLYEWVYRELDELLHGEKG